MYRWNGGSRTTIGKRLPRKISKSERVKKAKEPEPVLPLLISKEISRMPIDILTGAVIESNDDVKRSHTKNGVESSRFNKDPEKSSKNVYPFGKNNALTNMLSENEDSMNLELEEFIQIDSLPLSPVHTRKSIETHIIYNQRPEK